MPRACKLQQEQANCSKVACHCSIAHFCCHKLHERNRCALELLSMLTASQRQIAKLSHMKSWVTRSIYLTLCVYHSSIAPFCCHKLHERNCCALELLNHVSVHVFWAHTFHTWAAKLQRPGVHILPNGETATPGRTQLTKRLNCNAQPHTFHQRMAQLQHPRHTHFTKE